MWQRRQAAMNDWLGKLKNDAISLAQNEIKTNATTTTTTTIRRIKKDFEDK